MVDPDFESWARVLRREFLRLAARFGQSYIPPQCGLFKLALKYVKELNYYIVRNDKSNGIALVAFEQLDTYYRLTVPEPLYEPVCLSVINPEQLTRTIWALAKRIGSIESNPKWTRAITA